MFGGVWSVENWCWRNLQIGFNVHNKLNFLDRAYFSKGQSNDISPKGLDDFKPFAVLALVISWIETFQVNHTYSEKRWILALVPQAQMEHAWLFVQAAAQQQRWYVRHGSVKSLRCVWVTQWHPWLKNWVIWTKKCQWYGHFGVHGLGQSGSIGNHDNTLLYSLPDILRLYNKIKVFWFQSGSTHRCYGTAPKFSIGKTLIGVGDLRNIPAVRYRQPSPASNYNTSEVGLVVTPPGHEGVFPSKVEVKDPLADNPGPHYLVPSTMPAPQFSRKFWVRGQCWTEFLKEATGNFQFREVSNLSLQREGGLQWSCCKLS